MPKIFRFGPFTFDPSSGVLQQGDRPALLGSRAAMLLATLLEAEGRPVLKDALIERGWGGRAVEDSNLTVQIAAIRSTLREAGGADWIETLPRRGYRYAGPAIGFPEAADLRPRAASSSNGRPCIAVVPFENASPQDMPSYFAEGMVDDIIAGLSRMRWLSVIGKETSFRWYSRDPAGDTGPLRDDLGVGYVLGGSLRKNGVRVRLGVHLTETETGRNVWAERFERASEDLFALQDEVVLAVLATLEPGLRQAELAKAVRRRPQSLDAYDLVLRAQPDVFSGMPDRSRRALPLVREALELEPDYALAHGYASMASHNLFLRGGLRETDRCAAVLHARAAIQHGQDDSMALALGAFSLAMDDRDLDSALPAFATAIAVSPSTALAYMLASAVHGWAGDPGLAKEFATKALDLSPLDPWRFAAWHGLMLSSFRRGDFAESLDAAYRSIAANPGHSISYALLAAALARCGRDREARIAAARVLDMQPGFSSRAHLEAVNADPRLFTSLGDALSDAGLPP